MQYRPKKWFKVFKKGDKSMQMNKLLTNKIFFKLKIIMILHKFFIIINCKLLNKIY